MKIPFSRKHTHFPIITPLAYPNAFVFVEIKVFVIAATFESFPIFRYSHFIKPRPSGIAKR